jgi:O-antigen ligase
LATSKTNAFAETLSLANHPAAPKAFFWLSALKLVYCSRPEDWVPGLSHVPLAKITAICALWWLYRIGGLRARVLKTLPIESKYLILLIAWLFIVGPFSPIWPGGAMVHAIDFAKSYVIWILTFLLATDFAKFRHLIYIQCASVAVIALVSAVKGHGTERLQGVLGGIYSNPNDLAFAIVLSLPFCLAFLLSARDGMRKIVWCLAILMMCITLLLTASRAGFIDLLVAGSVCLWHFGIKGRRLYLIVITVVVGSLLMLVAGRLLMDRLWATTGEGVNTLEERRAYGSMEARKYLMERAIEGIEAYPITGVGMFNFIVYSNLWHEVHMTYLQIAVEGGIPALILYLLFFSRGFANMRKLRRIEFDEEGTLFVGALHSALVGFVVGALFAPEAYHLFPYFTVGYTSALIVVVQRGTQVMEPARERLSSLGLLHARLSQQA